MCDRSHRYTVEHEDGAGGVRYVGNDQDEAIGALVALKTEHGEVGYVTAEHVSGGAAEYCSDESYRVEDEAMKASADMEQKWEDAYAAFHGEGAYAIENPGW